MAAASTERLQQNKPLSVMDGVPVSIKDEFACVSEYSLVTFITHIGKGFSGALMFYVGIISMNKKKKNWIYGVFK